MELQACVTQAARCAHAWLPPTPKPQSRFGPLWILCQALENPWSCGVLCAALCSVSAVAVWRLEKRLGCCNGSCDPWRCTHMHKRSTYVIARICTTRIVARCTSHVGLVEAAKGKRRRLFGIAAARYQIQRECGAHCALDETQGEKLLGWQVGILVAALREVYQACSCMQSS
jgi:hypothetical protein